MSVAASTRFRQDSCQATSRSNVVIMRRVSARLLVVVVAVVPAWAAPGIAAAHGIGGRTDLPVPVSFFAVGAGAALIVSFVMLSERWQGTRLQEPPATAASPGGGWLRSLLRIVGIAGFVALLAAGTADGGSSRNIGPVLVFVYFWLLFPFLAGVFGDLWRHASPWAWISTRLNTGGVERPELLESIGMWPATIAFFAFTWLELVSAEAGKPRSLAVAALVYTAYIVAAGYIAGPRTGLVMTDAFHHYNALLGAIAPRQLTKAGWQHRRWLQALPSLATPPGFTAFVIAMIGTVSYDGLSGSEWWETTVGDLRSNELFETAALLASVLAIGGLYWLAAHTATRFTTLPVTTTTVAGRFAHTLIPIALAYAVAHYFTLAIFEGQLLLSGLSDPFGRGWDLFGTADWKTQFFLSANAVWYIQLAVIVLGHVAGVVLAHDRALADFGEDAVRTQYAMLILMVFLTSLGLFILAG